MTLRITRDDGTELEATLRLEGSLVGEWADLLDRECSGLVRVSTAVSLDLTGVRFVDRAGVQVLGRLDRAGVVIRCRPGALASVLEAEGIRVERDGDDAVRGRTWRPARNESGGKGGGSSEENRQ